METHTISTAWYKFVAQNTKIDLTLLEFHVVSTNKMLRAKLWSGACGSQTILDSDTITSSSDSSLLLNTTSLTIGNTYYVEILKTVGSTDTLKFHPLLDYGFFSTSACSCTSAASCDNVCNGGYEDLVSMPISGVYGPGQIVLACPWETGSFGGTPDVYNSGATGTFAVPANIMGSQAAHSGNGYAGFAALYNPASGPKREYIKMPLKCTLTAGVTYNVSYWISLADRSRYKANIDLIVYNGPNPLGPGLGPIPVPSGPIHTFNSGFVSNITGWTNITGTFVANGTEDWIIVGNFLTFDALSVAPAGTGPGTYDGSYVYIDDVSITPVNNLVVSASPTVITCGGTSTLSNNLGFYLNWSPSGTLSCNNCASPVASPLTTTSYIGSLSFCTGCSIADTVTVTVNPSITVNAGSDVTICAGQSTNLTATGATSYVWNPGGSTSNPYSVSPSSTTTYTVTGSVAGGCTNSDMVTVTVNPVGTVTITPSSATISAGGSGVTIAASSTVGGSTFAWLPTTGLSNPSISNPTANPPATTTYTVTATTPAGCTSTATVTITVLPPACFNTIDYTVTGTQNASTVFGGLTTISTKNIRINGTLVIDVTPFSFSGCNVIMDSMARITVSGSKTFNISNKTHVFSCTKMWDGIYISSGATIVVNGDSFIEDGIKAVSVASGSVASVNHAIFNRNYTAVDLTSNTSSTSPIDMIGTVITSRDIPSYSLTASNLSETTVRTNVFGATPYTSAAMKAPYTTSKAVYGVAAADVTALIIGNASATANLNGFENLNSGIYINNVTSSIVTTTKIYNNKFQNMINGTSCGFCPPISGIAIKAFATGTGNNIIKVGGTRPNQLNTIVDVYSGIELYNYQTDSVMKNNISATTTMADFPTLYGYGQQAIKVQPATNASIEVTQNTITNNITGVWINRTTTSTINSAQIYIDGNTITANASGRCTNAINLADVTNTGSTMAIDKYKVRNNVISDVYNCITATNVKNGLIVYQNPTLSMRNDGTAVNAIRITNCLNARVHDNPNITISPTTSPVTSTSVTYKGIVVTTSLNSWVSCNKIFSMGESMVFSGLCTGASIFNNQLTNGNRGFVLRSNGEVGTQGATTQPWGTWWGASFASHTHVEGTTNANSASKMYYNNTGAPAGHTGTPTSNTSALGGTAYSTGLGGLNSTSGSPQSCSITVFMPTQSNGNKTYVGIDNDVLEELATNDNYYPVFEPETQYHSKTVAYEEIDSDNGASIVGNTILENFYDSTQLAPLGQLKAVDKLMIDNNYLNADLNNSNISTSNLLEDNQKEFNRIYLLPINDSTYQYSQTDIDNLYSIAVQCPFEGGTSVWQARVLYCSIINSVIEFEDNCDSDVRMQPSHEGGGSTANFWVFPNPNDGNMTLVYHIPQDSKGMMVIYDVTGRTVKTYYLFNKSTSLKILEGDLKPGQYYCTVYINDILDGTQKLTIIK
jgi:hypothetical protein